MSPSPTGKSRGDEIAAQPQREWYSVQAGFWRSLWFVLRGYRIRTLKYLTVGTVPNLMPEEDE